jgi:spore maturation protein CgeB
MNLKIVIFGLSITSSWGNGHAATYRALVKALHQHGHHLTFIERDVPWYRDNRDLANADYCRIELYEDLREVPRRFGSLVGNAELVILGSYVPEGAVLADWLIGRARGIAAFYDIDTPVTLSGLRTGETFYISAPQIPRFDLYLSFTGGPTLSLIEDEYASPRARVLHCAADVNVISAADPHCRWMLGYLGTYSADRQPALERLLFDTSHQLPQERFVVAGCQYPENIAWPPNVALIAHQPQTRHAEFYRSQRYTLNITRKDMRSAGFSPSVRLFEAAAFGVPIISDKWQGLDTLFTPGREILLVEDARELVQLLSQLPEERRREIAAAAHQRLMRTHTPSHRARQLESYYHEAIAARRIATRVGVAARTGAIDRTCDAKT